MANDINGIDSSRVGPPNPVMLDDRPVKRKWVRWIAYGAAAIIGVIVVLPFIDRGAEENQVTALLRRASTDAEFAATGGITGKFSEAGLRAKEPPSGLTGTFYWSSRPGGADAEISTFTDIRKAAEALLLFRAEDPGSLLFSDDAGSKTKFNTFERNGKMYFCGWRTNNYSCGSIVSGAPAIVTIRLPVDLVTATEEETMTQALARTEHNMAILGRVVKETQ